MKFQIGDIVRVKTDDERVKIESAVTGTCDHDAYVLSGLRLYYYEKDLELIERPKKKVKRKYWFVSYKRAGNPRILSTLQAKESADALWVNEPDRQVHSIEIFEDSDE